VTLRVRDDRVEADFDGTSPASDRGINVVLNYTHAYTTYALKAALSPEVPNNEARSGRSA
jgi:N-methylhydantoinase B